MGDRLKGKVCIITGSSRGLGQYCAVGYAKEGATVVIAARTEQETDPRLPGTIYHTAKLVEEAGGEAFPVVCNVADNASVEAMAKAVLDKYGRVDVLMTNAAVQPPGFLSNIQIRHFELEFRVNVFGPFYCIRAVLPAMMEQRSGSIINISSVAADRGGSHYGMTKRAVESMTLGLANELRQNGIAVNCMKPVGGIETPGLLFGRAPGQVGGGRPGGMNTPPPDSYVEAAVILATMTPETGTGIVMNDAQIINKFCDDATKDRFRKLNGETWAAAMEAPVPQNNVFTPFQRPARQE
ncbi:MAG TPA: SDR family NAD(P)-dependent oxidoreductase [Dehalococcoidia bacterium]|nr:SDR family NAD(P)-dependent oxidoreductase [Dehalococcoidia bacterium]